MKRETAAREKRARFIAATEKGLSVSAAAEAAGVNRTLLYKWRRRYPDFAAQCDDATTAATEAMEDEALRRALEGVDKPVFYRGKQVGSFRSYNDRLLIRLLERRRPSPSQAFRVTEAQLTARLKAVEEREAALRQHEEALRKLSPTVSQSCLPPSGGQPAGSAGILPASPGAQAKGENTSALRADAGRMPALPGNALILSPTVSQSCRPPEGEGGAQRRKEEAATSTGAANVAPSPFRPFGAPSPSGGRPKNLSPAVSVPGHTQQGAALKAAGSAGILPASARSAEVFSPFACAPGDAGRMPALPGNDPILSPTVSVPARTPVLAIADHVYGRQYARDLKPLLVNAA